MVVEVSSKWIENAVIKEEIRWEIWWIWGAYFQCLVQLILLLIYDAQSEENFIAFFKFRIHFQNGSECLFCVFIWAISVIQNPNSIPQVRILNNQKKSESKEIIQTHFKSKKKRFRETCKPNQSLFLSLQLSISFSFGFYLNQPKWMKNTFTFFLHSKMTKVAKIKV